jgi:hypothetical protein
MGFAHELGGIGAIFRLRATNVAWQFCMLEMEMLIDRRRIKRAQGYRKVSDSINAKVTRSKAR